jgi:hypothetical protein
VIINRRFLAIGACLGLWMAAGCQSAPQAKASSPSVVSLSPDQASAVQATLRSAVTDTSAAPLQLLPASGVRWADVPRCVHWAGQQQVAFAMVDSTVSGDHASFRIRTLEGWPGWITASRHGDLISFDVTVGPYPQHAAAKKQASKIRESLLVALRSWGAKPQLPADS